MDDQPWHAWIMRHEISQAVRSLGSEDDPTNVVIGQKETAFCSVFSWYTLLQKTAGLVKHHLAGQVNYGDCTRIRCPPEFWKPFKEQIAVKGQFSSMNWYRDGSKLIQKLLAEGLDKGKCECSSPWQIISNQFLSLMFVDSYPLTQLINNDDWLLLFTPSNWLLLSLLLGTGNNTSYSHPAVSPPRITTFEWLLFANSFDCQ